MDTLERTYRQQRALTALVADQKHISFTDPAAASDEAALAKLVAAFLHWDGDGIIEVAKAALIEANFHAEARKLDSLLAAAA